MRRAVQQIVDLAPLSAAASGAHGCGRWARGGAGGLAGFSNNSEVGLGPSTSYSTWQAAGSRLHDAGRRRLVQGNPRRTMCSWPAPAATQQHQHAGVEASGGRGDLFARNREAEAAVATAEYKRRLEEYLSAQQHAAQQAAHSPPPKRRLAVEDIPMLGGVEQPRQPAAQDAAPARPQRLPTSACGEMAPAQAAAQADPAHAPMPASPKPVDWQHILQLARQDMARAPPMTGAQMLTDKFRCAGARHEHTSMHACMGSAKIGPRAFRAQAAACMRMHACARVGASSPAAQLGLSAVPVPHLDAGTGLRYQPPTLHSIPIHLPAPRTPPPPTPRISTELTPPAPPALPALPLSALRPRPAPPPPP